MAVVEMVMMWRWRCPCGKASLYLTATEARKKAHVHWTGWDCIGNAIPPVEPYTWKRILGLEWGDPWH